MTIALCSFIMGYAAITQYWNQFGANPPMDFRTIIIRFICLLQGHMTYQPEVSRAFKNLYFIITHPYNFTTQKHAIHICFIKFIVILSIETASMSACIMLGDAIGILTSFTAFAVIS